MGFITLEDIQGVIDLVLFPRPWKQFADVLAVGQIIIVEGKVDANSSPPKILVDSLRTDFDLKVSVEEDGGDFALPPLPSFDSTPVRPPVAPITPPPFRTAQAVSGKQVGRDSVSPRMVAETVPAYAPEPDWNDDDGPPPPEAFPPGWDEAWQPDFEVARIAARPEPKFNRNEPVTLSPEVIPAPAPEAEAGEQSTPETFESRSEENADPKSAFEARPVLVVQAVESPVYLASRYPTLYAPVAQTDDRSQPPKQITVLLRPTGDHERDKRRIKTLFGTLISFAGRDKFSFQIFEGGKGHLIDFPNNTTRICPELQTKLRNLMGEESWRVEEITFH
jgi:DNA polymerase-3 subunit alpha